jgi:uncharacterized protein (DUF302 family)
VSSSYGFGADIAANTLEEAIEKVTAALKEEGFGVLTTIDVKATLKKKIDVDFRPYTILGACNPKLAHRGLSAEPELGLLLPCNVVVQQKPEGGGFRVSFVDPHAMLGVVTSDEVKPVADEANEKLRKVFEAVQA